MAQDQDGTERTLANIVGGGQLFLSKRFHLVNWLNS